MLNSLDSRGVIVLFSAIGLTHPETVLMSPCDDDMLFFFKESIIVFCEFIQLFVEDFMPYFRHILNKLRRLFREGELL
jgi:hypothetical protein